MSDSGKTNEPAAEENRVIAPFEGGLQPPHLDAPARHVAIIMDGNGRWANARGLPRTEGHKRGEIALMNTIAGAVEAGVKHLTVYAFSTENWNRSPSEVRFLMGYSRNVIRRRAAQLHEWGVRINWWGRRPRLWRSVIRELEAAHALTQHNDRLDFNMAINYGGRAEIADAAQRIAREVQRGTLKPRGITEDVFASRLYAPHSPDVDLLIRTSGEQRLSNFLLWQCAYAEFIFNPTPWPAYGRRELWDDLLAFEGRDRRFGGAVDKVN